MLFRELVKRFFRAENMLGNLLELSDRSGDFSHGRQG